NVERGLTALAIAAQKFPEKIVAVGFQSPNKITGLLSKIFKYLAESGIYILPYGELENHLPSYNGCPYKVADNVKNKILEEELMWLLEKPSKDHIVQRYGKLSEIIEKLPSKQNIDIRPFLKRFLADHLHFLIKAIRAGEIKTQEQIASVLGEEWKQTMGFLKFSFFHVENTEKFSGELLISDKFGVGELICCFDQDTQTNNPEELKLEASNLAVEGIASEEKLKELV